MTAVLRMETINFATMVRGGETVKGIDDNGLVALMNHNLRTDIKNTYEVKSKRDSAIDTDRSKRNIVFKALSYEKIKKLQSIPHRKNQAGAFQMVFDFQDISEAEEINFQDKNFVKEKAKMILGFLKQQCITERFNLMELVYHSDEKNPHFHLTFSGFDNITQSFGVNEFFRPVVDYAPVIKNNKPVYKKYDRGKNRGQYMLDNEGNKISKTQAVRKSIMQDLQDDWNNYLIQNNQPYRNKKEITSLLQFEKSIWRRFSEDIKEQVYLLREKEKELTRAKISFNMKRYNQILNEITPIQKMVLNEAQSLRQSLSNIQRTLK